MTTSLVVGLHSLGVRVCLGTDPSWFVWLSVVFDLVLLWKKVQGTTAVIDYYSLSRMLVVPYKREAAAFETLICRIRSSCTVPASSDFPLQQWRDMVVPVATRPSSRLSRRLHHLFAPQERPLSFICFSSPTENPTLQGRIRATHPIPLFPYIPRRNHSGACQCQNTIFSRVRDPAVCRYTTPHPS